ncbi:MAG: winged helix-turn-helix domain-containing protein [Candidatus Methanoperedens sp.]|nr:winged helix-turn-helix domain-containing protein [Candidatus Methanoperedens sp.]
MVSKLVNTITFSKKRENLLLLLKDGPRTLEEIRNSLNVTSSGMIPQIRKLEEQKLVRQEGKMYMLTDTGTVIAEVFSSFIKTAEIIESYPDFWELHEMRAVPQHLLKRIYELGDCRLIESKISDIYEPHKEFMKYIMNTKQFIGIAPVFHQTYPALFLRLAENGTDVSIILTRNVYDKTQKEHADVIKKFIRLENAQLFKSNDDIRLASAVMDNFFSMSFFFKNNGYDSMNELVSSNNTAIRWGEELFDYFVEKSSRIKSL